jgi:hypothetical protein
MFTLKRVPGTSGSCIMFGCRRFATHVVLDAEERWFGWYCERHGTEKLAKLNAEVEKAK